MPTKAVVRFADLDPRVGKHPTNAGWWCISFTCPLCGPPYRVGINALEGGPPNKALALWAVDFQGDNVINALTITPSIDNSPGGHGRKQACKWHGSVIGGEIR